MLRWKSISEKGSVMTAIFAIVVSLTIIAVGALAITTGLWPIDRAWLWICLAWGSVGYICCRSAAQEGIARTAQITVRSVLIVAAMWLVGYLAAGEGRGPANYWGRYLIAVPTGIVTALILPRNRKRRKKRKIPARRPQKRPIGDRS